MTDRKVVPMNPPNKSPVLPKGYKAKPMAMPNPGEEAAKKSDEEEQRKYGLAIKADEKRMVAFTEEVKQLCSKYHLQDIFMIAGSYPVGYESVPQAFGTSAMVNSSAVNGLISLGSRASVEAGNIFNYVNSALANTQEIMKEKDLTQEDIDNA